MTPDEAKAVCAALGGWAREALRREALYPAEDVAP
jgi:hypothetical protein